MTHTDAFPTLTLSKKAQKIGQKSTIDYDLV